MIVSVAGALVAAAALPVALAVGLVPPLFVAPPQAARTIVTTRPSVAMVRCIRSSLFLDEPVGVDAVRTPFDETALQPGQAVVGEYLGAIHGIGLIIATAQTSAKPKLVW